MYIAGYLASLMIVLVVQAVLTRTGTRAAGIETRLDVYQVACLAGGPDRVVETAIAGLVLREQLLVTGSGRLTVVRGAAPFGPVEVAVCQELVALARTVSRVVSRLRFHRSVEAVVDQVRSRGLLLVRSRVRLWRLVLFVPVVVWCVGLVGALNSGSSGRPVGVVTGPLVVGGVVTVVLMPTRWWTARRRPSAAGRFAVGRLRELHRTGSTADIGVRVAGVAVLGFAAVADPALRSTLVRSAQRYSAGRPRDDLAVLAARDDSLGDKGW